MTSRKSSVVTAICPSVGLGRGGAHRTGRGAACGKSLIGAQPHPRWPGGCTGRECARKESPMNRILIATDGSDGAWTAVEDGVALAYETGAHVVFVTVRHDAPLLGDT